MEQFDFLAYDFKRNLILVGPQWIGKTTIAEKLLKKFLAAQEVPNPYEVYSVTDGRFKQMIQDRSLRLRPADEWTVDLKYYPLEMMIRSKLMLFDDLGASDATPPYLRQLTFILDERIKKQLTTIFTTNLTIKEIEAQLDARVASRITQNADVIQMLWDDLRKKSARVFEYKLKKEEK